MNIQALFIFSVLVYAGCLYYLIIKKSAFKQSNNSIEKWLAF